MTEAAAPFSSESLPAGSRIACRVEYDGSRYNGWQAQPQLQVKTVQQELESGLAAVAAAPVRVHCAGRTDTGVHGFCQVVHFDAPVARSAKSWVLGVNANLPADIRLHWAVPVASNFHARFAAEARCYRYIIANTAVRPALLQGQLSWRRRRLDEKRMHTAAQCLLGECDFSAFRAASCQSTTPMRNVHHVRVERRDELVVVDIQANAFLHHMVRNIVGSLMAVGVGLHPPQWMAQLLAGRDRRLAADTARPEGLYLVDVRYPKQFELPVTPAGPLFLSGAGPD